MKSRSLDKKTAVIIALSFLAAITGAMWLKSEFKPAEPLTQRTLIFLGYEAYLDRGIDNIPVKGPSMEPLFRAGDVLLWLRIDNKAELKVGDIILYAHPTRPIEYPIVHRIINTRVMDEELQFEVKGDANPESDGWISERNVVGLVIGVRYSVAPS